MNKKNISWLKKELNTWLKERIITEEQAEKIKQKYEIPEEKGLVPSKFIAAISIIGAVLLGAGIILLIASNWQKIPKVAKLSMLFGAIFLVNHFGYHLTYLRNYPKTGRGLLFLGSLLFGAGIWLVAQIYHITSRYHNGILFWSLGIFPVALLLKEVPILAFSSGLLTFWGIWKCIDFGTPNYLYLILMLGIVIPGCYYQKGKIPLLLSILGISLWFGFGPCRCYLEDSADYLILICYSLFGLFLYSVGLLHSTIEKIYNFHRIYRSIGISIIFGSIYLLSFRGICKEFVETLNGFSPLPFWIMMGILLLLVICLLLILTLLYLPVKTKKPFNYELILLLTLIILTLSFPNVIFYGLILNIMLLFISVGSIFLGYYTRDALLANLGFLFFAVHFITRYIDWTWRYLPRSVFFIIAGSILLSGGLWLEKRRKRIIERIKADG
ncbi:TPA: hypothetical protein DCX15_02495 [bacterium]|nr:hypothetical protein [bacterium]